MHRTESIEGFVLAGVDAPDPLVVEAETLLPEDARVLDLGAHNGRNGFYLAARGHHVNSVEIDPTAVTEGQKLAQTLGGVALGNRFTIGDMRYIELGTLYDAVMAINSLQEIPKDESYEVIGRMQKIVKAGGFNVIKAYIASPEQQTLKPEYALFEEDELQDIYTNSGWEIVTYATSGIQPFSRRNVGRKTTTRVVSHALLIAREVQKQRTKDNLLARARHYRLQNPRYTIELEQEANAL